MMPLPNSVHNNYLDAIANGRYFSTQTLAAPIAQLVERPLSEREVVGSNHGRAFMTHKRGRINCCARKISIC